MNQQEDLIEKFKKQYELFTNSIASSKKVLQVRKQFKM